MLFRMIKIGEKHEVVFAENNDGTLETEVMTLKEIKKFKGKEIYIYEDGMCYKFVTYNHYGNINWDFMEKINDKFGE